MVLGHIDTSGEGAGDENVSSGASGEETKSSEREELVAKGDEESASEDGESIFDKFGEAEDGQGDLDEESDDVLSEFTSDEASEEAKQEKPSRAQDRIRQLAGKNRTLKETMAKLQGEKDALDRVLGDKDSLADIFPNDDDPLLAVTSVKEVYDALVKLRDAEAANYVEGQQTPVHDLCNQIDKIRDGGKPVENAKPQQQGQSQEDADLKRRMGEMEAQARGDRIGRFYSEYNVKLNPMEMEAFNAKVVSSLSDKEVSELSSEVIGRAVVKVAKGYGLDPKSLQGGTKKRSGKPGGKKSSAAMSEAKESDEPEAKEKKKAAETHREFSEETNAEVSSILEQFGEEFEILG